MSSRGLFGVSDLTICYCQCGCGEMLLLVNVPLSICINAHCNSQWFYAFYVN